MWKFVGDGDWGSGGIYDCPAALDELVYEALDRELSLDIKLQGITDNFILNYGGSGAESD